MKKNHKGDLWQKFYQVIFKRENTLRNRQQFAGVVEKSNRMRRAGK